MKVFTLDEITKITDGMLTKVHDVKISQIAPPLLADENTLALALGEDEIANLAKSRAKAALVPLGVNIDGLTTIEVERPRLAMMKLISVFYQAPEIFTEGPDAGAVRSQDGIHPSAIVHETAKIGANVKIGPNVVIGRNAIIGESTQIVANAYIGGGVKTGKNCFFHPGVNIGDRVILGDNVILQHGVSLGADGFSFVTEKPGNIEQAQKDGEIKENNTEQKIFKIQSIGSVVIGNNVEIGANAAIDRGTVENTTIGDDTKIDNLVMIGHNCKIGKGCLIVSQVGIAGSSVIGDRVVLAGQVGVADHISIGADSIVAAKAGVSKSFPEKSIIIGMPAMPRKDFVKQIKTVKDAGELIAKFKQYEPLLKAFEENQ